MYQRSNLKEPLFKYIESKISFRTARLVVMVMKLYSEYLIDAILHGHTIIITPYIRFSFVKAPIADYNKYRVTKFFSSLVSDWFFFIDIQSAIMKKHKIRYEPSRHIKKKIKNFINSEKVYELIR